jgi:hypothetical protein
MLKQNKCVCRAVREEAEEFMPRVIFVAFFVVILCWPYLISICAAKKTFSWS